MSKQQKVGKCYGAVARQVMREKFGFNEASQDDVIAYGFETVEAHVNLAGSFGSAVSCLARELNGFGATIPCDACKIILHSTGDEPAVTRARAAIEQLALTENDKAGVAYNMLAVVHRWRQRENAPKFMGCYTYEHPMPTGATHPQRQPSALDFVDAELCGWTILAEGYPVVEAVLAFFGVTTDHQLVQQQHRRAQQKLVRRYGIGSRPALITYITENRVCTISSIDLQLSRMSALDRLADKISAANPELYSLCR